MGLFDAIKRLAGLNTTEYEVRPKTRVRTVQVRKTRPQKPKPKNSEHITLQEWKNEIQKLQSHPLTQAKIINERTLNSILELLEELNSKIDKLVERLSKLESRGTKPEKTAPIGSGLKLSEQEDRILTEIKKKRKALTKEIAKALRISRSNASLKLNRLYCIGILDKQQEGKGVFFKVK